MLQLAARGWELHYANLCDGSRGSTTMDMTTCAAKRLAEAQAACAVLGGKFYPPIYHDMEAVYTTQNLAKVAGIVRMAKPSIVLTHSPVDYMEDHEIACRLAVSAAFAHGMPNLHSDPPVPVYSDPVTVYHAQPVHNRVPTGELVTPHLYVDITEVLEKKIEALGCHESQKQWLDESQGQDSYLETARQVSAEVGKMSGKFEYAEGWRRREHWGFCSAGDDPLAVALAGITVDTREKPTS